MAIVDEINACMLQGAMPTIEELGGVARIVASANELICAPVLDVLVQLLGSATDDQARALQPLVIRGFAEASSAVVLRDATDLIIENSTELARSGRDLDAILRARVEARSAGGNGLIAAYALEGVLRLVLAGAGNRHHLVALLVDIRDDEPHLFAAHAAKIAGTAFHLWRERDLVTVLQRLLQNSDAEDEAAMELGLALLSDGLTATVRSEALSLLATAKAYFDRAYAAGDRRLDAAAYRSTIEVVLAFHEGVGPKRIAAAVRELERILEQRAEWLSRGDLPNWLRPRRDRETQWLRLARLAEHVAKALDRPSWLNASVVMDQVLAVYDADRTVSAGGGMAVLWRPRIVSALVRERGLLAHLDELLSADHWTTVHRVAAEELRRSIVLRGDPGESMGERHEGARFPLPQRRPHR